MGNKLFRKAIFGYNKHDVNTYFQSVSDKFTAELAAKDNELSQLREKLCAAQSEADKLYRISEEYESCKDSISTALLHAENKAAQIISDAKKSAEEQKQQIQTEIEQESARLRQLRQDVAYLRRSVTALINKFNGEAENFSE